MMRFKNVFTTFLMVASLLTMGLGCKGLSATEQASIRPVSLDYWTVFDNVEELRRLSDEYQKIRPYVRVNIRQVRFEEFDERFVNALADDIGPDIISIHVRDLPKYTSRLAEMPAAVSVSNIYTKGKYFKETVVESLQNALPSQNAIRANYISTVPDDITVGGAVYGLPLAVDTMAVYYNTDLLDKAGIATPPTNWEEFIEAVKKTTRFSPEGKIIQSGVALGTGKNIGNAPDILSLLIMQDGLSIVQNGSVTFVNGLDAGVQTHPAFQALQFYTDFARESKEVYSWNSELPDALDSFIAGRSVFYFGYAFDAGRIRSAAPQLNFATIPMFQLNPSVPSNVADYWVESVVRKSKHQNEAWDFIRFISQPTNIKAYTESTGQPSPLRAQIKDQAANPILAPFASQILNAKNWYRGSNSTVADEAFVELIDNFLKPYPEDLEPEERDGDLLLNAARKIQQTL